MSEDSNEFDIAIVGMAGRFPDANDVNEYWSNIENGHVALTRFSAEELIEAGISRDAVLDEDFVPAAPVLKEPARFDAAFFNYSPKEAELIDPQQRHLLETAWLALEDAGYDPARYDGRIATFAGTAMNTYLLSTGLGEEFAHNYLPVLLGSDKDFLATRIAFKLGIKGPAVTVQTACSTSLVALHTACQSLLNFEADMALVGASAIRCPVKTGHMFEVGSVFSKDGKCRPFDADASGTVFGSGVGVVVVKRYKDALEDNDNILALVKGSAINNDGATKSDFTAPSINQQAEAIADAIENADVDARSIEYVEAHGTGTFLGDPIEVEALSRAFRLSTADNQYCMLGSVKSNIGHLDAAAGMAALIKVVMAMKNNLIPATANYSKPNPQIDFTRTPFRVVSDNTPWTPSGEEPRRAGISSLGMGGTNAHVVVEHANEPAATPDGGNAVILPLSAKTDTALSSMAERLADSLENNQNYNLSDVAFTLQTGRSEMDIRRAFVASDRAEAISVLRARRPPQWVGKSDKPAERNVVMMFPGQGSQHLGMAAELARSEAVFRDVLKTADAICEPGCGYAMSGFLLTKDDETLGATVNETRITQPLLYTVEYAYAKLLESWGVSATAYIGHSIGEYVAATLAGVFSFEDGLKLVLERGRLMQDAPRGVMMSVGLPHSEVAKSLPANLDISVINSSASTVVSGEADAIDAFQQTVKTGGHDCQILKTSHAFHSRMMDDAATAFEAYAKNFTLTAPHKPFVSNVSGDLITPAEATSPSYWALQIKSTVQFAKCASTLLGQNPTLFVEAGPGTTLASLVSANDAFESRHATVSMAQHPRSTDCEKTVFLRGLAAMWTTGYTLDWTHAEQDNVRRVSLPGYPFEGNDYWFKGARSPTSTTALTSLDSATTRLPRDQWSWKEGWTHVDSSVEAVQSDLSVIVAYAKEKPAAIIEHLETLAKSDIHTIDASGQVDQNDAVIASDNLHLVYVTTVEAGSSHTSALYETLRFILAAIDKHAELTSVNIVTRQGLTPLNTGVPAADSASYIGMVNVLNHEYADVSFRLLDIDSYKNAEQVEALAQQVRSPGLHSVMGFRRGEWWALTPQNLSNSQVIRRDDTSDCFAGKSAVVIGAFGGVGIKLSRFLAGTCKSLILTASRFPAEDTWDELCASNDHPSMVSRIKFVRELRSSGSKVSVVAVDLGVVGGCKELKKTLDSKADGVDYVFHLAGLVDDGLASLKTAESFKRVVTPKMDGTRRLARAIDGKLNEKLVLFSSTAAWLGPVGQVDYASANAFQIGMAKELSSEGLPTVSVAWPGIKDTGMMSRIADPQAMLLAEASAIEFDELVSFLKTAVMSKSGSSVVISPVSIPAMLATTVDPDAMDADDVGALGGSGEQHAVLSAEQLVSLLWSEALGIEGVAGKDNFFELGGNSLTLTQVVSQLRKKHGIKIDIKQALSVPVFDEWLKILEESSADKNKAVSATARNDADDSSQSDVVATPGIARYIHRRGTDQLKQWNLSTILVALQKIDVYVLKKALTALCNHHDMLRGGFSVSQSCQFNMFVDKPYTDFPLQIVDFSGEPDESLASSIETYANKVQGSLDPENAELFKVILFECGASRPDRVFFTTHHFISDGLSWSVTLMDFQRLYQQLMQGKQPELPDVETGYRDWAQVCLKRSDSDIHLNSCDTYWLKQKWHSISDVCSRDYDKSANLNKSGNTLSFRLTREHTDALENFGGGVTLSELAMLALSSALCQWVGGSAALFDVVGNGRELSDDVDVTRTVGYYVSYTPVIVPALDTIESGTALSASLLKIREMLDLGWEHDLLRYVTSSAEVAGKMEATVPESQILFNYIGRLKENIDELADKHYWDIAEEGYGSIHNASARRDQPLAFRLEIVDGCLDVTLVYSTDLHTEDNLSNLLSFYHNEFRRLGPETVGT